MFFGVENLSLRSTILSQTHMILFIKQELKRFPTFQAELAAACYAALERFRIDSRKTTIRLVDMESSYLTVDFFRRLPVEMEKGDISSGFSSSVDHFAEGHFRKIASNVYSYIKMIMENLRISIPKAVVHCQVREAKRSLLDYFYAHLGKKEVFASSHF